MRGSREISLVPSLHRASTDALIYAGMFTSREAKRLSSELPRDVLATTRDQRKRNYYFTAI